MSQNENEEARNALGDGVNPSEGADAPKAAPKKKKQRTAAEGTALPKDKNKRVREQAARKMEEAKASAKDRAHRIGATGLDAGDMFDDALARSVAAVTKWAKKNRVAIEITVVALIVGGFGYATVDWYMTKRREEASSALMLGATNAAGVVESATDFNAQSLEEAAKRQSDRRPRFESTQALEDEALRTYRIASDKHTSSAAGVLARLGEAGVLLDRRNFDGAIDVVNVVLATDLAKTDESVRMAAKERLAMALEGKGDIAGALAVYVEITESRLETYKNLGLYHQSRLAVDADNKAEAREKLDKLAERIAPKDQKEAGKSFFLVAQVHTLARKVDPEAAAAAQKSGSGQLTPEQYIQMQQYIDALSRTIPTAEETVPEPAEPVAAEQPSAPDTGTTTDKQADTEGGGD